MVSEPRNKARSSLAKGSDQVDENREALALMLLKEGSKDHAIQLYREETGAGYFDAKTRVEELADRHGMQRSHLSRWTIMWLLVALFGGFLLSH
jgi:hypothetical protein